MKETRRDKILLLVSWLYYLSVLSLDYSESWLHNYICISKLVCLFIL